MATQSKTKAKVVKAPRQTYLGNNNLKPAGFKQQYTFIERAEYARCADDPIYFIEHYVKITTLDFGEILFTLYPIQRELITTIHTNRKVITMQGRQQGKTQTSAAYILWYVLFNESKHVAILANKLSSAREVMSRFQDMYEGLPKWLQQGVIEWNKGNIKLENGSKAFCAATTKSAIRGKTINFLYIDETAFIPNNVAEEFFTSAYPTISSGKTAKILLSSTPLGYNHFWKFWSDAEKGLNDFVTMFVPYWKIPGRDDAWAEEQRRNLGELKFNQEVLCNFLGSSNTLIGGDFLAKMSPHEFEYTKDSLDICESPKKDRVYTLVADTSRGLSQDYSAFAVIDSTDLPYKLVAKYRNNTISPLLYPSVIYKVAKDYNNAIVLVEINDNGQQIADILNNDLEYENMLFVSREKGGQRISPGFNGRGQSSPGVRTDKLVKRVGCTTLRDLVHENKFLIHDPDVIRELSTFIEVKGSYQADDGYHDDLAMCLVLFAWMTTNPYFKELTNVNLRESIYQQRMENIQNELTPFGVILDGREDAEPELIMEDGDLWSAVAFAREEMLSGMGMSDWDRW